ncbi:MAG: hypothetical protein OEZ43_07690 [Gammaproteobacteria bacterium]|nr:hypothetical protein [Gammaproteobacteria bacterium]
MKLDERVGVVLSVYRKIMVLLAKIVIDARLASPIDVSNTKEESLDAFLFSKADHYLAYSSTFLLLK